MAKTKTQKEETLKKLQEKLSKMKAAYFTNYDGLTAKETVELRRLLREQKVDYEVIKKTLLKIALKKAKIDEKKIDEFVSGLGIAFSYDDEVAPARILDEFAKNHRALKIVGGIFEGKIIGKDKANVLAKLPSKNELLTKLTWLIQYPISGLVNVLQGNLRNLVYVLKAIFERKPTAG